MTACEIWCHVAVTHVSRKISKPRVKVVRQCHPNHLLEMGERNILLKLLVKMESDGPEHVWHGQNLPLRATIFLFLSSLLCV